MSFNSEFIAFLSLIIQIQAKNLTCRFFWLELISIIISIHAIIIPLYILHRQIKNNEEMMKQQMEFQQKLLEHQIELQKESQKELKEWEKEKDKKEKEEKGKKLRNGFTIA